MCSAKKAYRPAAPALPFDSSLTRRHPFEYTQTNVIVPDAHGDWLNQRDDSYAKFMRVDGKKTKESSIFFELFEWNKKWTRFLGLQQFKE